ncbi:MAG: tetratricopeptide repeat protein [Alphaproteobacteria bacterium]
MYRFFYTVLVSFVLLMNSPCEAGQKHQAEHAFKTGARLMYGLEGTTKDFRKGYELLLQAAEKGHPIAIYCLACCSLNGEGVDVDHDKARILYQQSADFDYGPGQFNVGIMAKNGDGGPVDNVLAYYYLCLASLNHRDLDGITIDAAVYRDQVAVLLTPAERQQVLRIIGQRDLSACATTLNSMQKTA